jgi:transposase
MSYIRHKIISGKKYAYEITSFRDPETKKVKNKSVYLGAVNEDGIIKKNKEYKIEKSILDFGDGYLFYEFFKHSNLSSLLDENIRIFPEIVSLIIYRICYQSAMYNAASWCEGNVLSVLCKNCDLSSQNISRVLTYLGQEEVQRSFFDLYLKSIPKSQENIIIDASSLPNQICHPFSEWGHADSSIEKQFRFLCVIEQKTKTPLFYRFLPGNIVDISSLKTTIDELKLMRVKNKFILLDAGYYSEENILELYENSIDFLIRLPSQRSLYKAFVLKELDGIEQIQYATKYDKRVLFVKPIETALYGKKAWVYIVLDPARKAKEINAVVSAYLDDYKKQCYWLVVNKETINFKKLKLPKNCISCYVKMENNHEQLFYVNNQNKQIELLSINKENQEKFFQLSKNIPNKSFLSEDVIEQLIKLSNHEKKTLSIEQENLDYYFKKSGVMILVSSKKIESIEIISSYYIRQNIEQIFGFFKDDLDLLPIRKHNDNTIKGYLFLQFITLILFLQFRNKLEEKYTVEQAVLLTRNLKCKVFEKNILVLEANKKQTEIYQLAEIVVPKNLGI